MIFLRWLRFLYIAISFVIQTAFIKLLNRKDEIQKNKILTETSHMYSRKVLRLFDITVDVKGGDFFADPCLILSNHLSYTDILILSSVRSTQFVSHMGVKSAFLVGTLAASGGTLFVDKSSPSKLSADIKRLSYMLKKDVSITLFPEGATGNGESVIHFYPALIESAIQADAPVLPVCIEYIEINGQPVTKANRDMIYIYGGIPFLPHIFRIMNRLRSVKVELYVFEKIYPVGLSRKEIAAQAHKKIADRFRTL